MFLFMFFLNFFFTNLVASLESFKSDEIFNLIDCNIEKCKTNIIN